MSKKYQNKNLFTNKIASLLIIIFTLIITINSCLAQTNIEGLNIINNQIPLLGVYDPANNFQESKTVEIEHHFIFWRLDNADELITALEQIKNNDRIPLITLESWAWNWNNMTEETLFTDILAGKYDPTIERIFQVLKAQSPQKILFRWGHEMEIIDQYPWSKADARRYIQVYHYLHDFSELMGLNNLIWVWSPAGFPNATDYWVGRKYVDLIGLSIYATKEWNEEDKRDTIPSFAQLMQDKYWFSKKYHKPLILAEVGVNGVEEEKNQWLIKAIEDLPKFPQVKGFVYFDQVQPPIVPLEIGFPDWSLNSQQVKILLKQWQNRN